MSSSLRSFLHIEDFNYRLSCVEGRLKDLLQYWQVHTPHFTCHGSAHCEAVEKNLDEIISYNVKTSMNEYEIFLLLSSVFLHDIGIMCASKKEEEKLLIRKSHHERSRNFVNKELTEILSLPERHIIGEICLAHRDTFPINDIEVKKIVRHQILGNKEVRVQFLAALLRLADCCDICHTRTSEGLVELAKLPDDAKFYHNLHERVSGISFDEKEKTIRIDFNIASKREKSICNEYVVASVQKHLNSVRDSLTRNGLIYISVIPSFSISNTIKSKLDVPKKEQEISKVERKKKQKFSINMHVLIKHLNYYKKKNIRKA